MPKPHQAKQTCFVNHIPLHSSTHDIAKIFNTHGPIEFIYIPVIRPQSKHKCAFVQFKYPQSLPTAIRDENRRKVETNHITVHPAKYDKPPSFINKHIHHNLPPPPKRTQKPITTNNAKRDWRSYKEAVYPLSNPPHIQEPNIPSSTPQPMQCPPLQNPPISASPHDTNNKNTSTPNPSRFRQMSSRTLGEDTEKVRNSLGEIDLDDDYMAAFEGKICEENQEMLERSAIAIASSSQSSEIIMEHIYSEGVNCLKVKAMGGMMHLIIFDTFEDKKAIMESNWLDRWFMVVRNVNDQSSSLWRETWIRIHGVPLIAWGYDNFYKIGCIFGRVISVNYNEFDCAYIQVFTDGLFELNGKLSMGIGDKTYPVYVSEVKFSKFKHQKPATKPTDSPATKNVNSVSKPEKVNNHLQNEESLTCNNLVVGFPTPITHEPQNHTSPKKSLELPNGNYQLQHINQDTLKIPNNYLSPLPRSPNLSSASKKLTLTPTRSRTKSLISSPLKPKAHNDSCPNATSQPKIDSPSDSPIKVHNKFGPLLRQSSKPNSSSGTIESNSCSGPLFPPGFEENIPAHFRTAQEEKRRKKMEKKKKIKGVSARSSTEQSQFQLNLEAGGINVDDVIEMADILGLVFNGPISELRSRIELILHGQKQVWDGYHQ